MEGSGSGIALQKCPKLGPHIPALSSHCWLAVPWWVGRGRECIFGQGSSLWQKAVPFGGHVCDRVIPRTWGDRDINLEERIWASVCYPLRHQFFFFFFYTISSYRSLIGESYSVSSRIHLCHLACILGFWCLTGRPHLSLASFLGQPGSWVLIDWSCVRIMLVILLFFHLACSTDCVLGSISDAIISVGSPISYSWNIFMTDSPTPELPLYPHLLLPLS